MNIAGRIRSYSRNPIKFAKSLAQDVWWTFLAYPAWPITKLLVRLVCNLSNPVFPEPEKYDRAYLLVGPDRYFGRDLEDVAEKWLRESMMVPDVRRVYSLPVKPSKHLRTVAVASRGWVDLRMRKGFLSLLREAVRARRAEIPVWTLMPDVFYIRFSTFTAFLVAIAGGATVLLPNSVSEASKYGLPFCSFPHFWIFPPSEIALFGSAAPHSTRPRHALVAWSGNPRRTTYFSAVPKILQAHGFTFSQTSAQTSDSSWAEYASASQESRLTFTTTWLQPFFYRGPRYYRNLLPTGVITGRVWEAFASGQALVTNRCKALDELGFEDGHHYFEAPLTVAGWKVWKMPGDEELQRVALNGQTKFLDLVRAHP